MTALEIVNAMDLDEGHVLTEDEGMAIESVLRDAWALRDIRRALGFEDDFLDALEDLVSKPRLHYHGAAT